MEHRVEQEHITRGVKVSRPQPKVVPPSRKMPGPGQSLDGTIVDLSDSDEEMEPGDVAGET